MVDFTQDPTDFSGLYRDPGAPLDKDPTQALFEQVSAAAKAASAQTAAGLQGPDQPAQPASGSSSPAQPATGGPSGIHAPAAPAPAPAAPAPNPASTANPSADEAALLQRLAPVGITSLSELHGKTDADLQKLSGQVLAYETRQQSLSQSFAKNPDGSWDFTKAPDGTPTGLDASGKVVPTGTAAGAGAPGTTPAPGTPSTTPAPAKNTSSAASKKAALAGIRKRALAKGLHPSQADILATYNRYHKANTVKPKPTP